MALNGSKTASRSAPMEKKMLKSESPCPRDQDYMNTTATARWISLTSGEAKKIQFQKPISFKKSARSPGVYRRVDRGDHSSSEDDAGYQNVSRVYESSGSTARRCAVHRSYFKAFCFVAIVLFVTIGTAAAVGVAVLIGRLHTMDNLLQDLEGGLASDDECWNT